MAAPPNDRPIYIPSGGESLFAVFHPPVDDARRDTAVILCPPFGWEEVCSYRSRREWAQGLARAGYWTLRLSYPGSGDSGGSPRDPARLDAWTEAVSDAAGWLRAATSAPRLALIGIELGGLLAFRAAAAQAPVDDLVLWNAPVRGRVLLRKLKAFSRLELSELFTGLEPPPPPPEDELEAGGFLLTSETVQSLERVELTELQLRGAATRRVLLLGRDGIAPDAELKQHIENCGVAVSVDPGIGYGAMTSHPQQARTPAAVIERVVAWLDEASPRATDSASMTSPGAVPTASLRAGVASAVRERPVVIEQPFGRLAGVLSEPPGPRAQTLCAVFLNAGAIRRIGPNRMWVEAARRWAARGLPALRLDIEGLGDSDGDPAPYAADAGLYVPELVPQVLAAIDYLQQDGVGDRFMLVGLCAGAYWSFHAALQDARVVGAVLVNPRALIWDPSVQPARDFRALMSQPLSLSKIRKEASAERVRLLARWMLSATRRSARDPAAVGGFDHAVARLQASQKRITFLFSDDEPLRDELVNSGAMTRLEQSPNVTIEYIGVRDHTLRPTPIQHQAHAALDRALGRELAAPDAAPPPVTPSRH